MVNSDWQREDDTEIARDVASALSSLDLMRDDIEILIEYLNECLQEFDETDGGFIHKSEELLEEALNAIKTKNYTQIHDQVAILQANDQI